MTGTRLRQKRDEGRRTGGGIEQLEVGTEELIHRAARDQNAAVAQQRGGMPGACADQLAGGGERVRDRVHAGLRDAHHGDEVALNHGESLVVTVAEESGVGEDRRSACLGRH